MTFSRRDFIKTTGLALGALIYSDPWNPELPGSQAAQGGIPAERIYLVKNGVLENLIYSRFWAK
jgi:predicted Zn-dependent protease